MYRAASCIGSEETLPILSAALQQEDSDASTNLRQQTNGQRANYGTNIAASVIRHKYPIAVFFILMTKFFEAFAANGMRTILALYLRDDLYFSENFSTVMLHIFNFFGQFCPIFGAIISDSYLGNVRTIASFCFLYAFGWILLTLTTFPTFGASLTVLVSLSLLFIAIGNGSIRANITSLGALQFKVPEQADLLAEYFSLYYFVYYFGIFLSKLIPPMVRANTSCFNKNDCYPAVFGTLGASFLAAWFIFTLGRLFYKPEKPTHENILVKFYGCIKHALTIKWQKSGKDGTPIEKRRYWLHYAIGDYEESFVNDVAKVLKLSKLFIPLPIYFALLAQQDSSWTFQASMMNTTLGNITIQPDQAKAIGPIFLFILIPFWQYICAPIVKRIFNSELKPLHSMTLGGVCSSLSFVCAGVLQEYIYNNSYKSVNISWQFLQFFLIMMGELLLSIPGLQFAFTQAPGSMKSVVTAAWFLNNAFGNLIVVLITELDLFSTQSLEYFFYAGLMIVSIITFTLLAHDFVVHERLGSFYSNSSNSIRVVPLIEKDEIPSTSSGKSHDGIA